LGPGGGLVAGRCRRRHALPQRLQQRQHHAVRLRRRGRLPLQQAPISVYFAVRQYWGRQPFKEFTESYCNQRRIGQELVASHIIPAVVRPLAQTIAAKQLDH
jgi:hypothetical protein